MADPYYTPAHQAQINAQAAASDARYQPQSPGMVVPAVTDSVFVANMTVTAANRLNGVRVVIPRTGRLRDVSVFIGAPSGNLIGTVYDTGDASAGNRTKLWDSGSVAAAATNDWQTLGDPNLAVTAGQQVDLGVIADNGVVTIGRQSTGAAGAGILPTNFFPAPGGAQPKLSYGVALGSFAAPATIAQASLTAITASVLIVIARVS